MIKFFTHNNDFKREVENRMNVSETADGIVPIIHHYSTIGNMPINSRFKDDLMDESLVENLISQGIVPKQYGHAIVMPRGDGDLFDYLNHTDLSIPEIRSCLKNVGEGLRLIHEKGKNT